MNLYSNNSFNPLLLFNSQNNNNNSNNNINSSNTNSNYNTNSNKTNPYNLTSLSQKKRKRKPNQRRALPQTLSLTVSMVVLIPLNWNISNSYLLVLQVIRQIGSRPKEELDKEFKMLCLVTSSHVVKCFGACLSSQLTCIVMELCSRDTLYSVLNKEGIKWSFGIQACIEAVTGLRTLHVHQPPILHRDLKSLNLLVTEDWHIKLCDFGLSQFEIPQNFETLKEVCGTFAYSDPQVFNGNPFSIASDIYSMGIIFWEISQTIVMGRYSQPYSEYKNISFDFQILIRVATQNLRPTFSPQTPQKFQILTEKMLHNLQQERPGSLDILEVLETIKESGEVEG
eukprot:TRINITY_DN3527_c0_g3_i1.p1 TRINITY_DN3527_c0_g3~~TRINITY_DN3527_c0_g3_i1.p1  ORF type:complete len:390 (-),score=89.65 TRINITY_DN3527_c0_g3_i1:226-1245(-)